MASAIHTVTHQVIRSADTNELGADWLILTESQADAAELIPHERRMIDAGEVVLGPEPAAPVPQAVTQRQLRLELLAVGVTSQTIESQLQALPEPQ